MNTVSPITIIHQADAAFAYRVEIKDANSYGLGFGDTPRLAYAEARRDYQEYRRSDTRASLEAFDDEFVQAVQL